MRYISSIVDKHVSNNGNKFMWVEDSYALDNIVVCVRDTKTGNEYCNIVSELSPNEIDYGLIIEYLENDRYKALYRYDETLIKLENCIEFIEVRELDLVEGENSYMDRYSLQEQNKLLLSPIVDYVPVDDEYPVTVAEYLWKFATPSSFSDNMSIFCVRVGLCDFAYYHLSEDGKILLAKLRLML